MVSTRIKKMYFTKEWGWNEKRDLSSAMDDLVDAANSLMRLLDNGDDIKLAGRINKASSDFSKGAYRFKDYFVTNEDKYDDVIENVNDVDDYFSSRKLKSLRKYIVTKIMGNDTVFTKDLRAKERICNEIINLLDTVASEFSKFAKDMSW